MPGRITRNTQVKLRPTDITTPYLNDLHKLLMIPTYIHQPIQFDPATAAAFVALTIFFIV
jgi:hypothetical protein